MSIHNDPLKNPLVGGNSSSSSNPEIKATLIQRYVPSSRAKSKIETLVFQDGIRQKTTGSERHGLIDLLKIKNDISSLQSVDISRVKSVKDIFGRKQSVEAELPNSFLPVVLSQTQLNDIFSKRTSSHFPEVTMEVNNSGIIRDIKLTRPDFLNETRKIIDAQPKEHIRHEVPWSLIKMEIISDIKGKSVAEVEQYLINKLEPFYEQLDVKPTIDNIPEGIQRLAALKHNNLNNLWAGSGKDNMILGHYLHKAYQSLENAISSGSNELSSPFYINYGVKGEENIRITKSNLINLNQLKSDGISQEKFIINGNELSFQELESALSDPNFQWLNNGNEEFIEVSKKYVYLQEIKTVSDIKNMLLNGATDWSINGNPEHNAKVLKEINYIMDKVFPDNKPLQIDFPVESDDLDDDNVLVLDENL